MHVRLRPWTLEDVEFTLSVRNNPDLMKYFRQNRTLTYAEQEKFIRYDTGEFGTYNGLVIEWDGVRVGLCSVKDSDEFAIGLLPQYHHKGIATEVMKQLVKRGDRIWSEVFVGNPALEFFISKCGFKIYSVRERAYYKPEHGLVDIVSIKHD